MYGIIFQNLKKCFVIKEDKMKKIDVNISEEDMEQLRSGEHFNWNFDGVEVHLFMGEEED